jgi:hypothetical protein
MKEISDTKILVENRHKDLLTLLYVFAKMKHFPRILIVSLLMTNGKQHKQFMSFQSSCITSDLATFRNVEFYVKCCNPGRLY